MVRMQCYLRAAICRELRAGHALPWRGTSMVPRPGLLQSPALKPMVPLKP